MKPLPIFAALLLGFLAGRLSSPQPAADPRLQELERLLEETRSDLRKAAGEKNTGTRPVPPTPQATAEPPMDPPQEPADPAPVSWTERYSGVTSIRDLLGVDPSEGGTPGQNARHLRLAELLRQEAARTRFLQELPLLETGALRRFHQWDARHPRPFGIWAWPYPAEAEAELARASLNALLQYPLDPERKGLWAEEALLHASRLSDEELSRLETVLSSDPDLHSLGKRAYALLRKRQLDRELEARP